MPVGINPSGAQVIQKGTWQRFSP